MKMNPAEQERVDKWNLATSALRPAGSFRHGGKVKRTGVYRLHKGERVLTKRGVVRKRHARSHSR